MNHFPKDVLSIGHGAEYVIRSESGIIVLSSGVMTGFRIERPGDDKAAQGRAWIEMGNDAQGWITVLSGSETEMALAIVELHRKLVRGTRRSLASRFKSLAVTCAAIAVITLAGMNVYSTVSAPKLSLDGFDMSAQDPVVQPQAQADASGLPAGLDQLPPAKTLDLKIVKRPDFLNDAADAKPTTAGDTVKADDKTAKKTEDRKSDEALKAVAPAQTPDAAKSALASAKSERKEDAAMANGPVGGDAAIPLPAYSPDLYKDPSKDKPAEAADKPDPKAEEKKPETAKADVKAEVSAKPAESATATAKAQSARQSDAAPQEREMSADEIAILKAQSDTVIAKLMGDGMDPAQASKLLLALKQIDAVGYDKITPDMLQGLPEDVVALLTDKGMGGRDLEGEPGGKMAIIPTEVVNRYRGKDGIATIPENYSWYARKGGPVNLPLPGGGDIKSVEDFKDFGFKP